jgi:tRNA G37 N-methylase TrmD
MLELLIGTAWTFAAGFIGYAIASARYRSRIQQIETNLHYLRRYTEATRKRIDERLSTGGRGYHNA